jgi:pyruvate,orthophosphate dikinase
VIHPLDADLPPDAAHRLGPKGEALARLRRLGLPVPDGFVLETDTVLSAVARGGAWPENFDARLAEAVERLSEQSGARLGDPDRPLLLAVRAGGEPSLPGASDSLLDVGLTRAVVAAGAGWAGSRVNALRAWCRFVRSYAEIVLDVHPTRFDRVEAALPSDWRTREDEELLSGLGERMLAAVREMGMSVPDDAGVQLRDALAARVAVHGGARARYRRKHADLSEAAAAPVVVQRVVRAGCGPGSGAGRASSRDPRTGAPGLVGEWSEGAAQAADAIEPLRGGPDTLAERMPDAAAALEALAARLEVELEDAVDLEFTLERGVLWLVTAAPLRRGAAAAVRIAVDLAEGGLISRETALRRVDARALETLLRPIIAPDARRRVVARGLPASPGAATGRVAFDVAECERLAREGEPALLVRVDTAPEDLGAFAVVAGVLTQRGGQTGHAAVAARDRGIPCVVSCQEMSVDAHRSLFYANDEVVQQGAWLTIDGATGEVMLGRVETAAPEAASGPLGVLLGWADDVARLKVYANADSAVDAARARALGARGVGLCRTEHGFFQPESLLALRRALLAEDGRSRARALADALPAQRDAFVALLRAMEGLPVTVRLLDPPMTSFLPSRPEDVATVAAELGMRSDALAARIEALRDVNPMIGHRGVRVGLRRPELIRLQVRALMEAACIVSAEGLWVLPEIMVPFVVHEGELSKVRSWVVETAEAVLAEHGRTVEYHVGTMIELPRAALLADRIAAHADFFSFGTNDLTQTVWGLSRDDLGQVLPAWIEQGVVPESPMMRFDVEGVGALVRWAAERGRAAKRALRLVACGEHAGDPVAIAFFHDIGLDAVSCSPFRVPVARLAAALAALEGV